MLHFVFYTVAYIIYEAAFTAVSCPYSVITPELTVTHDDAPRWSPPMAVSIGAGLAAPLLLGLVIFPMFPRVTREPTRPSATVPASPSFPVADHVLWHSRAR
jgi:Na+/melibiose symporter-like transporter